MTDYPKCQTCEHWTETEYGDGGCAMLTQGSAINTDNPNDAILHFVADGYPQAEWGGLFTLPTFGCALHSERAVSEPDISAIGEEA